MSRLGPTEACPSTAHIIIRPNIQPESSPWPGIRVQANPGGPFDNQELGAGRTHGPNNRAQMHPNGLQAHAQSAPIAELPGHDRHFRNQMTMACCLLNTPVCI